MAEGGRGMVGGKGRRMVGREGKGGEIEDGVTKEEESSKIVFSEQV